MRELSVTFAHPELLWLLMLLPGSALWAIRGCAAHAGLAGSCAAWPPAEGWYEAVDCLFRMSDSRLGTTEVGSSLRAAGSAGA